MWALTRREAAEKGAHLDWKSGEVKTYRDLLGGLLFGKAPVGPLGALLHEVADPVVLVEFENGQTMIAAGRNYNTGCCTCCDSGELGQTVRRYAVLCEADLWRALVPPSR